DKMKRDQEAFYKSQAANRPAIPTAGGVALPALGVRTPLTPRGIVADDIRPVGAGTGVGGTLAGGVGAKPTIGDKSNVATIQIQSVCPTCNKKVAKDTAIEVVDGKISNMQRDQINHAHGSY
ncbi:MAG TPA: hypothetical protein VM577_08575, partial [Anaerovoracaceae bacterium]|nr:hypothetical protein [Anaerovoracaceae bacterium]